MTAADQQCGLCGNHVKGQLKFHAQINVDDCAGEHETAVTIRLCDR